MLPVLFVVGVLSVVALLVGVGTYNKLVTLKNMCDNGFSQIEIQLKRRYDLIPNLVESVKGYITHERETLERVIQARNQAAAGLKAASQNPANGAAVAQWAKAEGSLSGALGQLSFVMESYPDLKASDNVLALTEELTSTENKIAFARQSYNDWVLAFNTARETFPNVVLAGTLGFPENRSLLEFEDAQALQNAPTVSLA